MGDLLVLAAVWHGWPWRISEHGWEVWRPVGPEAWEHYVVRRDSSVRGELRVSVPRAAWDAERRRLGLLR